LSYKLIGLSIQNFQKIKVFNLEPKGNVIKITGANASGKSSVLDAMMLALSGARNGPTMPVRKGAGRGVVRLDLGDIRVTRMWSEGGDAKGEMQIEAEDGRRYGTPQRLLDSLMGRISFDPLAFKRMDSKQQGDELRKLLNLDIELAEIREKEQADYTTRREQTKLHATLVAQRAAVHVELDLPEHKLDLDAMTRDLASAAEFNVAIEREQLKREQMKREQDDLASTIEGMAIRAAQLEEQLKQLRRDSMEKEKALAKAAKAMAALPPLATPKDATALSEEIANARVTNQSIDRKAQADRMDEEIGMVAKTVAKLDSAIGYLREKATKLISEASYPIPGLSFRDDEVIYNDLPFMQASDAEQIRVSIAIGMALNPKLRIMRIKDGSLLDDESMQMIDAMATEHEFQVFIEIVDTSGKIGVYLIDGEIAAINGETPAALALKPALALTPRKKAKRKEAD
jgi:hypothetical protein